jgi:uncharacterized protein
LKKYFAHAFILTGLLVTIVSCAPVLRLPLTGSSAQTFSQFSFLGAAMLLALASLATVIGVLMHAKQNPSPALPGIQPPPPRLAASLLNLSPLALFIGLPMAHLLIPLWILRRARNPALRHEAARVLDFQITWTLFVVVGLILCTVLVGIFLVAGLLLFQLIVSLIAAGQAWRGRPTRFPMSLIFLAHDPSAK